MRLSTGIVPVISNTRVAVPVEKKVESRLGLAEGTPGTPARIYKEQTWSVQAGHNILPEANTEVLVPRTAMPIPRLAPSVRTLCTIECILIIVYNY